MRESGYQAKIIKAIEAKGGHVVNGNFTKAGEADLQCGYPVDGKLLYIAVEVKTEADYYRVKRAIDEDYNIINSKSLKKHEPMQMAKIRAVRKKGGLALIAYHIRQVEDYVKEQQ